MLSIFKRKESEEVSQLKAYLTGKVIPLVAVNDGIFSAKLLGDGLAIEPKSNVVIAPANGIIVMIPEDTKHAVGMTLYSGMEILIHIGIDTINLKGKGFKLFVHAGDRVKAGDKLIEFDADLIKENGYPTTTILVIPNSPEYPENIYLSGMDALAGETVIVKF